MRKEIDTNYDDLDVIIENDIRNNFPTELDCLSTHTYIESVDDISIESEEIEDNIATLEGNASIYLELQYNSDRDNRNGDGLQQDIKLNFNFKIELDLNKKTLIDSDYSFDIDGLNS